MITTERKQEIEAQMTNAINLAVQHNLPAHKTNGVDFWLLKSVTGRQTKKSSPLATYIKIGA